MKTTLERAQHFVRNCEQPLAEFLTAGSAPGDAIRALEARFIDLVFKAVENAEEGDTIFEAAVVAGALLAAHAFAASGSVRVDDVNALLKNVKQTFPDAGGVVEVMRMQVAGLPRVGHEP